jgi:23S rRNA pseudouridine2605 synthase
MIERGRVAVDGRMAQVGDKADPTTQRITVDGEPIRLPQTYTYVMLYKPRGVISTNDDPEAAKPCESWWTCRSGSTRWPPRR